MDSDNSFLHVRTDYIYKNNPEDVERKFDTSDYEFEGKLPKGKNKKVIGEKKSKDLKLKGIMFLLKKLIRLL